VLSHTPATYDPKVQFLVQHRELLADSEVLARLRRLPRRGEPVPAEVRRAAQRWRLIAMALKRAGLASYCTYSGDLAINDVVRLALQQVAEAARRSPVAPTLH
jgi:hypothetical protein